MKSHGTFKPKRQTGSGWGVGKGCDRNFLGESDGCENGESGGALPRVGWG